MPPTHRTGALGLCLCVVLLTGIAGLLWHRLRDAVLDVRVEHDGASCGEPCRNEAHWSVRVRGRTVADPQELRETLRAAADRARTDPAHPEESERQVVIQGTDEAPWGLVQNAMNECAKVGIYKIDWRPMGRASVADLRLPRLKDRPRGCYIVLEEIRIFMKFDPRVGETLRKIGNRGMVDSDEDLMAILVQYVQDYAKAGKTDFPVLIDATPDVPWADVIHVVELVRKEKLKRIEFAAPLFEIERPAKR